MKNRILCGVMSLCLCFIIQNTFAQLTIENNGNVTLGKQLAIGTIQEDNISLNLYKYVYTSVKPFYGVRSILKTANSMPIGDSFAIHGHTDASDFNSSNVSNYVNKLIGVLGEVSVKSSMAQEIFCAGVAGVVNNSGIAVYGAIKQGYAIPTFSLGTYAGYFSGPVKVTGAITASSFVTLSDEHLKRDIEGLQPEKTRQVIQSLRPVSYYYNTEDSVHFVHDPNSKGQEGVHYGLIAQDVQKVFPDIVYDNAGGYLSVNYVELIPLLIQTVQELSAEIAELKENNVERINARQKVQTQAEPKAVLYQNNPNPFTTDTEIKYRLPATTQTAALYVYNMNGQQIETYPISSFQEGTIIISAGTLDAGMYLYSLIADGQVIDTKRMILTK